MAKPGGGGGAGKGRRAITKRQAEAHRATKGDRATRARALVPLASRNATRATERAAASRRYSPAQNRQMTGHAIGAGTPQHERLARGERAAFSRMFRLVKVGRGR